MTTILDRDVARRCKPNGVMEADLLEYALALFKPEWPQYWKLEERTAQLQGGITTHLATCQNCTTAYDHYATALHTYGRETIDDVCERVRHSYGASPVPRDDPREFRNLGGRQAAFAAPYATSHRARVDLSTGRSLVNEFMYYLQLQLSEPSSPSPDAAIAEHDQV
jgi:hypothetical protein